MDTFVVRSAEAGTFYRAVSSTEHVRPCYVDLGAALYALPTGVPLSTECYEPREFSSRFRCFNDMSLTIACHLINFDVGGGIGTLHWIIVLDPGLETSEVTNELGDLHRGQFHPYLEPCAN